MGYNTVASRSYLQTFTSLLRKQAGKGDMQNLPEEERARIFDKARASVISEFLLARLKLADG